MQFVETPLPEARNASFYFREKVFIKQGTKEMCQLEKKVIFKNHPLRFPKSSLKERGQQLSENTTLKPQTPHSYRGKSNNLESSKIFLLPIFQIT